jgi:excinuclease ABC subunit C
MIVFTNGLPDQREYRHFKMHTKGPNDFAMMAETMRRRFSGKHDWRLPDVILIDGGKGQLSSVSEVLNELGVKIPRFGLAKRYEEVIRLADEMSFAAAIRPQEGDELIEEDIFTTLRIRHSSPTLQLLQRVRDEAHRFAVSYHTHLRDKRTKTSELDGVRGVGPATRRKLVRSFGSVAGVRRASLDELCGVVNATTATAVYEALHADQNQA